MRALNVAILGATGVVGRELMNVLQQRHFPVKGMRLLASERSAGKTMLFNDQETAVEEVGPHSFEGIDVAFIAAGTSISRQYGPIAVEAGALVIDKSNAFRMDPEVPLVVPEVNADDMEQHKGIIASPNCSTIQMVVAIYPLHQVNPIRRIVVDSYQSVSGWGAAAMDELNDQVRSIVEGREPLRQVFPHQIAFNILPEIDVFFDDGYTGEEWKMVLETRKIMHADDIAISATCVRVPVHVGHSEAVNLEFSRPFAVEEARQILATAPGVKVLDDPKSSGYPTALLAAGRDEVFVGRIRQDISHPNGLVMWVVSDNLRKGAALNAIQIAEVMLQRGWL